MAPVPALELIGLDPGAETDLTLGDLDFLVLAFFVFATRTVAWRYLCKENELFEITIKFIMSECQVSRSSLLDVSRGTGQLMDSLSIKTPHRVHSRVERCNDIVDLGQQRQVPEETEKKHRWGL